MKSPYVKILASTVNGLIFPFLFFRFRLTPWSDPVTFWYIALVCFSISFLVYKYRKSEGTGVLRTYLTNFVISFLGLCGFAAIYFLIVVIMRRLI